MQALAARLRRRARDGARNFGAGGSAHVDRVVGHGGAAREDPDELRRLVRQLVRTLAESGTESAEEPRRRAEELSELLAEEQPDPEHVSTRWSRLKSTIPTAPSGAGAVSEITGLVQGLV